MANLDDFFKKKDTKKCKTKKFAVNNPLSLNTNDNVKNGKAKQEKPTSYNSSLTSDENDLFSSQTTDEWKDYVEEEKKDYSGLKIQNLQINDEDNDKQNSKQNDSEEETEINEQGETVVKKKSGPWRMIQEQRKEEVQPPAPVQKVETAPPKDGKSSYIPPHQRFNSEPKKPSNSKRTPSDLSSEELFPTLGSTVPKSKTKSNAAN